MALRGEPLHVVEPNLEDRVHRANDSQQKDEDLIGAHAATNPLHDDLLLLGCCLLLQ